MKVRDELERAFIGWSAFVLRHRVWVILASAMLVGGLAAGLPRLEIETAFDTYLPRDNPAQQVYRRFQDEFGSGERIVLLLRSDDLYRVELLEELADLHDALEERLPYVDDITSLVNARVLIATSDSLTSEGLLEELPRDEEGLDRLRRRVRSNPLYRNVVVSADETATAIIVELDGRLEADPEDFAAGAVPLDGFGAASPGDGTSSRSALLSTAQTERLAHELDAILDSHTPSTARLFVAGPPLLAYRLGEMLTRDIVLFVSVSLLFSAGFLFLLFRSLWATIHPLLVVGLSVVGTLGWMGWVGIPITAVTEILPTLLIAAGVGDAVHIQSMYLKGREQGLGEHDAIGWSMGHSGLAVLLTSVTTAASMSAFRVAELQPVIDLGRAAPVGVALAFVFSTSLLPALLSLTPIDARTGVSSSAQRARHVDALLLGLGRLGTRHPRTVLGSVALLAALALVGASSLRFSQDDLRWLPEDDSIRRATEEINRAMRGAEPFELLVDVDHGADVRDPAVLHALEEIADRSASLRVGAVSVAQTLSLVDAIEETHRALGDDPEAPLVLPTARDVVSQELLLFEIAAPDDLDRLVSTDLRTTRIAMTVPFVDAVDYPRFSRAVMRVGETVLAERGLDASVRLEPTGLLMIAGETFDRLFVSMARSYAIAFASIGALMLLLVGNLRIGLLTLLPNMTPILLVLGLMHLLDAPLDISSMLVGGILIGVIVDDTIHFAHNFGRYRDETGCALRAIEATLTTTGRAMLVTSVTLSIGFFVFTGAWLSNVKAFGLLCGIGVVLAFLADVVMMPALVALAAPCTPECEAHHRGRRGLRAREGSSA